MPIDYTHEHFATSIIQTGAPHTPIPTTGDVGDVVTIVDVAGQQAFAAPSGGEQTVTLLGPFRVDFADPLIFDGIELVTLDAGTLIVSVAWIQRTQWLGDGDDIAGIVQVPTNIKLLILHFKGYGGNPNGVVNFAEGANAQSSRDENGAYLPILAPVVVGSAPAVLYAFINTNVSVLSQGSADVYALIATPA